MKIFRRYLTMLFLAVLMMVPGSMLAQDIVDTMKVQLPEGWSRPEVDKVAKAQNEKRKKLSKKDLRKIEKSQLEERTANGTTTVSKGRSAVYYKSYDDFKNDRWVSLDSMGTAKIRASQTNDGDMQGYNVQTMNNALNSFLKKNAFIVVINDSMFVNLNKVKGENYTRRAGFEHVYRLANIGLVFGAPPTNLFKTGAGVAALTVTSFYFGMPGAIVYASVDPSLLKRTGNYDKPSRGYLITGEKVPMQWINEDVMVSLLSSVNSPESLVEEYQNVGTAEVKNSFAVQKSFLDKAGLLVYSK